MPTNSNDENIVENLEKRNKLLLQKNAFLLDKTNDLEERLSELIEYSDTSVVDSDNELKIIKTRGNVENIFGEKIRKFETGVNLATAIRKVTRNTVIKNKFANDSNKVEILEAVSAFMKSEIAEKEFSVLGERNDGEMFLLIWKMKRYKDFFRSFFKIIPSNSIVRAAQLQHKFELQNRENHLIEILKKIPEGITLLDNKKKIIFMNETAKLSHFNEKIKDAPVEGRFYHEIFVTEDKDNIRIRIEKLEFAMKLDRSIRFIATTMNNELMYYIYPITDFNGNLINVLIISLPVTAHNQEIMNEVNFRLVATVRYLIHELEEFQSIIDDTISEKESLKQKLYEYSSDTFGSIGGMPSIIDELPLPVCILSIPGYRYEYANKEFCNLMNVQIKDILGKKDDDLFLGNDLITLENMNFDSVNTGISVDIDSEHLSGKQVTIYDSANHPKNLLRIFTRIEKENESSKDRNNNG